MTIALLAKYLSRRCSQCSEPQIIHAQGRFFKRPLKIGVGKADASDHIDKVDLAKFISEVMEPLQRRGDLGDIESTNYAILRSQHT